MIRTFLHLPPLSVLVISILIPLQAFAMTIGGGGPGPAGTQLFNPSSRNVFASAPGGLAVRPGGGFAVVIPVESEVRIFDGAGAVAGRVFVPGRPRSVAFLPNGQILVGNESSGEVARYTQSGTKAGFFGKGAGEFQNPIDIAVDTKALRVWVVDSLASRLRVYGWDGRHMFDVGSLGSEPGELDGPNSAAVHPQSGEVYVSDFRNKRIQIFGRNGTFEGVFPAAAGPDEGSIFRPSGIAIDGLDRILVSGAYQGWVQAFDAAGNYLGWCTQYGPEDGRVMNPADLAVGPGNTLYVASYGSSKVEVFDSIAGGTFQPPTSSVPEALSATVTFPEGAIDPAAVGPAVFRIECPGVSAALVRDRVVRLDDALTSQHLDDSTGGGAGVMEASFSRAAVCDLVSTAGGELQVSIVGTTLAGETFSGGTTVAFAGDGVTTAVETGGRASSPGSCGADPAGGGSPLGFFLLLAVTAVFFRLASMGFAGRDRR